MQNGSITFSIMCISYLFFQAFAYTYAHAHSIANQSVSAPIWNKRQT